MSYSIRRVLFGAALPLCLVTTEARAQDTSMCEPAIIGGTNGYRTARLLGTTNARAFGTPRFAERMLFPTLAARAGEEDQVAVSVYEGNFLFGVTQVPTYEIGAGCPSEYKYAMREVDAGAFNLGIAARQGAWSFFYSGGLTASSAFAYEDAAARSHFPIEQTLVGLPMALLAPLYNKRELNDGTTYALLDYMAGIGWDSEFGGLRLGYVGSTGLYTNITERKLRLFAAAVLRSTFEDLPYLIGGLDKVRSPVGYTSVFGRMLPLYAPPRYDEATSQPDASSETNVKLSTAHLRHVNLLEVVDVDAAYALTPEAMLHEGRLGLHTPGYHWFPDVMEEEEPPPISGGLLVAGGLVQLPAMYYYGVEGGSKKSFRVEAQLNAAGDGARFGLNLSARYNEPDTLATFPYAQDVWNFYFNMRVAVSGQ